MIENTELLTNQWRSVLKKPHGGLLALHSGLWALDSCAVLLFVLLIRIKLCIIYHNQALDDLT